MDTRGIIGQIARIREQANLHIEEELRKRSIEGIVPAHGAVLVFLFRQSEPIAIREIVAHVGRVKSTVTGMLNTLEANGYVLRLPCEEDSRITLIELTDKGRELQVPFDAISAKLLERVYGSIPQRKRERVVRLLEKIEENLCAEDAAEQVSRNKVRRRT